MRKTIILFILAVAAQYLCGEALQEDDTEEEAPDEASGISVRITGKDLSLYFSPEYNRSLDFCWDLSAVGVVTLNDRYTVKGGFALGTVGNTFDIKAFAGGGMSIPVKFPFDVSLFYNYNGLPEYESHTHSILPLVSFNWSRAGFSLGTNLRFTRFFDEVTVFEPIFAALVYVNIISNDFLKLGLKIADFDDFTYGNLGSYFLNLYSLVRLNERLSLINEIDLRQSGSIGLSANFYGFVYRGGVKFLW